MKAIVLLCLVFVVDSLQDDCSFCIPAHKAQVDFLVNNVTELVQNRENYLKHYTANLKKDLKKDNKAFGEMLILNFTTSYLEAIKNPKINACIAEFEKNVRSELALLVVECANLTMQGIAKNLTEITNNLEKAKVYIAIMKADVSSCKRNSNPAHCVNQLLPIISQSCNNVTKLVTVKKTTKKVKAAAVNSNRSCFGMKILGNAFRKDNANEKLNSCMKQLSYSKIPL